ncbi:hypothetical protein JCM11251_006490 [Rhodosporidiobolus azoricus]
MLHPSSFLSTRAFNATSTVLRPLFIVSLPLLHRPFPFLLHTPAPSAPLLHSPTLLQTRAFGRAYRLTPAGDLLTSSELASHPSARKLLDWQKASPSSRSVEVIKRKETYGGRQWKWEVEVYLQDARELNGTDLKDSSMGSGVNEELDEALTKAAGEALDWLSLTGKDDYPAKQ